MYFDILTDEIKNLLEQYEEQFGEMLPLMEWDGSPDELVAELKSCMESGVPWESDLPPECDI